ncbi:sensor histidine kinase [Paenibacillus sp. FSL K6-2862]|uniref:sensor histidine kinase n=1 Tax=Paenibacillus sp. FSL K6-2862 TaxID=2921484 RepID=UPI0030F757F1
MTYKQIKWMILLIPTITVALWEYVRHQFLLPYISMNLGNWLTPVLVYLVSITLLTKLFRMLERIQKELQHERSAKVTLEARENLARELHDGIAQSLFLLSVKAEKLNSDNTSEQHLQNVLSLRKTIHEVNRYVRQAITNLRLEQEEISMVKTNDSSLINQIHFMARDIRTPMEIKWELNDQQLDDKEKIELLACVRETLMNMDKHAAATAGSIFAVGTGTHTWKVVIKDNGKGFTGDPFVKKNKFGLQIMKERCKEMGWMLNISQQEEHTIIEICKEVYK